MPEVKLVFKNYKLLKEQEINLHNGSIFLIQGPNNVGKTTFVNAIKAIMEVKDETVNPVSHGEQEGFITGSLPGADGKTYQFRYDFNIDGKSKFIFIDQEGKSVKSIMDMRKIFNYTHFTIEEFFAWSQTEGGRKKQMNILLGLLNDEEQKEIADIDKTINTADGTLFAERTKVNSDITIARAIVENNKPSAEDERLINSKEDTIKLLDNLIQQRDILNNRIAIGEEQKKKILLAEQVKIKYDKSEKELSEKEKRSEELTREIEDRRRRRKEIITTSKSIPEGYEVNDDGISIDGVPFVETDLSKSSATKAIAKLMVHVNEAPVMLMGDADALGFPVLNELNEYAKEHNKIMVFAEHVRTVDDLHVVCYDEIDKI